ncbi:MAG: hypothetical protein ACR2HF_15615 [Methylococcaceae bacterium]
MVQVYRLRIRVTGRPHRLGVGAGLQHHDVIPTLIGYHGAFIALYGCRTI